jgi:hypothetical protein
MLAVSVFRHIFTTLNFSVGKFQFNECLSLHQNGQSICCIQLRDFGKQRRAERWEEKEEAGVKKNVSPKLGKTNLEREIQMTAKILLSVLLSF